MSKPVIGINCDLDPAGAGRTYPKPCLFLYTDYFDSVVRAGGVPLLIPFLEDQADIEAALGAVDGLLLVGGGDVDPTLYGQKPHRTTNVAAERRQRFDASLARTALAGDKPVLGICMGVQMMNVAAGGTLLQHIDDAREGPLQHSRPLEAFDEVHEVRIVRGSRLAGIVQPSPLNVNSTHHQAIDRVAAGFEVSARADDGVIEAIERPGERLVLGVQWHPERLTANPRHLALFQALVAASAR